MRTTDLYLRAMRAHDGDPSQTDPRTLILRGSPDATEEEILASLQAVRNVLATKLRTREIRERNHNPPEDRPSLYDNIDTRLVASLNDPPPYARSGKRIIRKTEPFS